LPGERD